MNRILKTLAYVALAIPAAIIYVALAISAAIIIVCSIWGTPPQRSAEADLFDAACQEKGVAQ